MPQYTHDELLEAMLFMHTLAQLRCVHAFSSEDELALLCSQATRLFWQGDYYAAFCSVADYLRCAEAYGLERPLDPPQPVPAVSVAGGRTTGLSHPELSFRGNFPTLIDKSNKEIDK